MQNFAILLLATALGATIQLNMIGAQSFLLSKLDAIYLVYSAVLGGLLATMFFKYAHLSKSKFALFSTFVIGLYIFILLFFSFEIIPENVLAFLWPVFADAGQGIFYWIVVELTMRHLAPARAQAYFSYLTSFYALGVTLIILFLKIFEVNLSVQNTLFIVVGLFVVSLFIVLAAFVPKKNIEIRFSKDVVYDPSISSELEFGLKKWFILVCVVLGAARVAEKYLVNLQLKAELQTFSAISSMIIQYTLIASIVIVVVGLVTGRFVQSKRPSPLLLIKCYNVIFLSMSIVALLSMNFTVFIALEVVRRGMEQSIYIPGHQMILSSLMRGIRRSFRSFHRFYYYTLVCPILAIIFYFTKNLSLTGETYFVLWLIILFLISALFFTTFFGRQFVAMMYEYLNSKNKTATILAAQSLSYLRPKNYVEEMSSLLKHRPKKLLKKTIILGLGHTDNQEATNTIIDQFKSDKEEIQIAVLDALNIAKNYKSVQFMLHILNMKVMPKSLQVRLSAISIIASMYHKKAIPILLDGLDDADPRVTSNSLETLALFNDKKLLPYFKQFVSSEIPRVKANALMGCASFKETKPLYKKSVDEIFKSQDLRMLPSILYIVGKLRDKSFLKEVLGYYDSQHKEDLKIKAPLAWALCRLKSPRGFELAAELMAIPFSQDDELVFNHFLSQMDKIARFDLIKYLFICKEFSAQFIKNVSNNLHYSRFDFHEELDYLHILQKNLS